MAIKHITIKKPPPPPPPLAPRRIAVKDGDGEFLFDLPVGARLTFGPDVPYGRDVPRAIEPERTYSLRVYRGSANHTLCACFPRVLGFRECSIPVQRVALKRYDAAGGEYLMLASVGEGFSVPLHWTLHRRANAAQQWGPAEHVCGSRVEAEAALTQMVAATDRLREQQAQMEKETHHYAGTIRASGAPTLAGGYP